MYTQCAYSNDPYSHFYLPTLRRCMDSPRYYILDILVRPIIEGRGANEKPRKTASHCAHGSSDLHIPTRQVARCADAA